MARSIGSTPLLAAFAALALAALSGCGRTDLDCVSHNDCGAERA